MEHLINKINEAFRSCFSRNKTIISAETTNDIDAEVQESIKKIIPRLLNEYLSDSVYKIKGSVGAGRATKTPWIAILDKDITATTREGVYIVFLFSSDCQHVYITLNQGTTQPNQFGPRLGKREINKKAQEIRDNLAINNDILKTDGNADVYDERYQAGAIYYTLWDVDDDQKDKKILDSYIQIYQQYKAMVTRTKNTVNTVVMPKYYKYLTALRTKPFMLLAGISGTGKSRIVREMAKACWASGEKDYGNHCPRNFCMVQVKPNWHDSSELIGYVSRINGEKYIVGPFLRFIAQALKEPQRPYFLCLDEMNLAPVEQYFAEFLSVIESRHLQDDGQIVTDPIVPYEDTEAYGSLIDQLFESDEERKAYKTEKIEEGGKRLTIPQNLFVVGTVNMDETTFSFSRKVLDRAMTIEMNEVKLNTGLNAGDDNELGYIGSELIGQAVEGRDIYADHQPMCDEVIAYLERVNEVLDATPFKIAYRTRNEFLLYAVNRKTFAPESELWQTLDEMTSMKILSRIEGDTERCERPLRGLEALLKETLGDHAAESVSLRKIEEMTRKLQSGYTSYWT